ncbi:Aldo/keto reductase family protein [Halobellus salinus]|nr:Aldo/keto reductase family protein [Halobellus salinus]
MGSALIRTLPGGDDIPMIDFGTWNLSGETVKSSVRAALESGYSHIDTAEGYKNCSIENAVRESDHSVLESFLMFSTSQSRLVRTSACCECDQTQAASRQ